MDCETQDIVAKLKRPAIGEILMNYAGFKRKTT